MLVHCRSCNEQYTQAFDDEYMIHFMGTKTREQFFTVYDMGGEPWVFSL